MTRWWKRRCGECNKRLRPEWCAVNQDRASTERIYAPIKPQLAQVEEKLRGLVPPSPPPLAKLLRHLVNSPGKLVRPAIALLSSRFHPNDGELAVTMATAVELLHLASLVHDDTVDNSSLRRGVATVSSLWGSDVAVQLGDFVFATSAVFACDTNNLRIIRRFSETIKELASGQLMESFSAFRWAHSFEQYQERVYNKTASLFSTAAECGAIISGAPESTVQGLKQYGYALGMAFQIVDDILDFESTQEEVGKPVGHDLLQGIVTLPALLLLQQHPNNNPIVGMFQGEDRELNHQKALEMIHGSAIIQESYAVARQFSQDAVRALESLPDTAERRSLVEMAHYMVERRR